LIDFMPPLVQAVDVPLVLERQTGRYRLSSAAFDPATFKLPDTMFVADRRDRR
jgi:hypothetical protein